MSRNLRRLGLVALLFPATTGYTAGLGPTLGNLDLAPRCWQRVFAWAPTFPWNGDGSPRDVLPVPHIGLLDAFDILVQLLDFGCGIHLVAQDEIVRSGKSQPIDICRRAAGIAAPVGGIGRGVIGTGAGAGAGCAGSKGSADPRQSGDIRNRAVLQTRAIQMGEKRRVLHGQH